MKLFNILGAISLSLITFVLGTILTYFLVINNAMAIDNTIYGSYVSGAGSFLGGLFGGILAYFVAKGQLSNEKRKDSEKEKKIYRNILKALKVEIEHNITIFESIIQKNDIELKIKYCTALENNIWSEIKFDIASLFDTELYNLLNLHFKECNDLKLRVLPDYQDLESFDFTLRKETAQGLIKNIQRIERKLA